MLSRASSSSSFPSICFFCFIILLLIIVQQPVISARKLANTPTGNGKSKIGVGRSPSTTAPSATGGQSSPTPVTGVTRTRDGNIPTRSQRSCSFYDRCRVRP